MCLPYSIVFLIPASLLQDAWRHAGSPHKELPALQATFSRSSPRQAGAGGTDARKAHGHAALSSSMQRLDDALLLVADALQPDDLD